MSAHTPTLALAVALPIPTRPRPARTHYVANEPPTTPLALGRGYAAALAGRSPNSNPYALGLPCDNESQAMLWDDGFRVGRRHPKLRAGS